MQHMQIIAGYAMISYIKLYECHEVETLFDAIDGLAYIKSCTPNVL